jgi:hypothetical protein
MIEAQTLLKNVNSNPNLNLDLLEMEENLLEQNIITIEEIR